MQDIEDIIGVNSKEDIKGLNKTSIMTTSDGKTLKRKNDDAPVTADGDDYSAAKKEKLTPDMIGDKPELTISLKPSKETDANA